jgi:hypothetical protein
MNSPDTFDNTGNLYQVTNILNDKGNLDVDKYQTYSEPWMSAGTVIAYTFYFVMYSASESSTYIIYRISYTDSS